MVQKPVPADRRDSGSPRWQAWLLVGLCFGLGYGVTHRLLGLRLGDGLERRPGYGFKAPPGTRLEDLRRQEGNAGAPIRADLDKLEKEAQQRKQRAEAEKRRAEAETRRQEPEPDSLEAPAPPEPEAESPPAAPTPTAPAPQRESLPPPAEVLAPPPAVGNDPPPPPTQP